MQRRHRRHCVTPVEGLLPSPDEPVKPHVLKPSTRVAGEGIEQAVVVLRARRHPRRHGGHQDEQHARHAQQRGEPLHEPHPLDPATGPQHRQCDDREREVRVVDGRRDVVVPAHVARVVEAVLHPHVRVGAEEHEPVDVARRLHLIREAELVRRATGHLVAEPHQAVEDAVDRELAPPPPRLAGEGAHEEDPHRHRHGDAVDDQAAFAEPPHVAGGVERHRRDPDDEQRIVRDDMVQPVLHRRRTCRRAFGLLVGLLVVHQGQHRRNATDCSSSVHGAVACRNPA